MAIRDKEFLVEMRLKNHDQRQDKAKEGHHNHGAGAGTEVDAGLREAAAVMGADVGAQPRHVIDEGLVNDLVQQMEIAERHAQGDALG